MILSDCVRPPPPATVDAMERPLVEIPSPPVRLLARLRLAAWPDDTEARAVARQVGDAHGELLTLWCWGWAALAGVDVPGVTGPRAEEPVAEGELIATTRAALDAMAPDTRPQVAAVASLLGYGEGKHDGAVRVRVRSLAWPTRPANRAQARVQRAPLIRVRAPSTPVVMAVDARPATGPQPPADLLERLGLRAWPDDADARQVEQRVAFARDREAWVRLVRWALKAPTRVQSAERLGIAPGYLSRLLRQTRETERYVGEQRQRGPTPRAS